MFTKEIINDYADKLLIGLSEEETNTLLEEFDVIKENMEIISDIDGLDKVIPMHYPVDITLSNLRKDEDERNISTEDALKNASNVLIDVVEVPKVV